MKNGCNLVKKWHTKIFSIIDPVWHCYYNGAIGPKMRFGCNFWLEGPFDLRPTCLNCILQDIFRDTSLDHIWLAQICTPNTVFGRIWLYLAYLAYLARAFRRAKYRQVGYPWKDLAKCSSDALTLCQYDPPVKSYEQIKFLADFPIVITM